MAYPGWDRNEMLQVSQIRDAASMLHVGCIINDTPCSNSSTKRAITSFTPINNYPTQAVNPQHTLLIPELDSNSLCNLPVEDVLKNSRKRAHAPNVRELSYTTMWEYHDPEDLGPAIEEQPPKRKKAISKNRAQSMTKPITEVPESDHESNGLKGKRYYASQLTTPPDSGKRSKSAARSLTSKFKGATNAMFKNPIITKPLSSPTKEFVEEIPTPQPVRQFLGFTTTEDALKSSGNGLSQTTMAKFDSFRFRPLLTDKYDTTQRSVEYPESRVDVPVDESAHLASNPQFREFDNVNRPPAQCGPNFEYVVGRTSQQENPGMLVDEGSIPEALPTALLIDASGARGRESHDEILPNSGMPEGLKFLDEQDDVGYGEPDSSEANVWTELLRAVDVIEPDPPPVASPRVTPTQDIAVQRDSTMPYRPVVDGEEEVGLPASGGPTKAKASCFNVEVERSDIEEEPVQDERKELYNDDEFDDGLDDDDLLAVLEDNTLPQTPSKPRAQLSDQAAHIFRSELNHPKPPQVLEIASTSFRGNVTLYGNPKRQCNIVSTVSSPGANDVDDEFPMDDGDEDQLLSLLDPFWEINEGFIPPPSVQDDFDDEREVYDSSLQFSPPKSRWPKANSDRSNPIDVDPSQSPRKISEYDPLPVEVEEDWSFIRSRSHMEDAEPQIISSPFLRPQMVVIHAPSPCPIKRTVSTVSKAHTSATQETGISTWSIIDDSHEYEPLEPFVRPPFLPLVMDRCPVLGISSQTFLRTCFRIGEMFQQGTMCNSQGLDAVIELFARVNFSSRESGTTKQHFQFLDLWHDRGPYPNGILANYKTTGLAESESRVFLDRRKKKVVRVLGKLKRDKKHEAWWLQVINIRETDWEEIRWTKRIVSGDDLATKVTGRGIV